MNQVAQDLQLGTFAGRYTYDAILVGSKTGETLMAFDDDTLAYVVIKRPSLTQPNPDLLAASLADLAREARALKTQGIAGHAAVCALIDTGSADGHPYLVLERARGTPLPELVQRYREAGTPLPVTTALQIVRQLLDLLTTAHRADVVYNDVKAEHLFWDEAGAQLKVIDWGNAQFVDENATRARAADVFQCGQLLYELLTGERYVDGAADRLTENPIARTLAPELAALLARALHRDSAERFASADALAAELDTLLGGAPVAAPVDPETARPPSAVRPGRVRVRRKRRRRPRRLFGWLLAFGGALALVALVTLFLTRPRSTTPAQTTVPATPIPTEALLAPTVPLVAGVPDDCGALAAAERDQQWEQILALAALPTTPAECDGRVLADFVATAHFRVGAAAYLANDYDLAAKHWTAAQALGVPQDAPLELLLACATARAADQTAGYAALVETYGVAVVRSGCGFDPPVSGGETPAPAEAGADIDLLAAMEARYFEFFQSCSQVPCPGLYQDDAGNWQFSTFFDNDEGLLVFDSAFQVRATGQRWGQGESAGRLTFGVTSLQPYSFPYGAELGLGVGIPGGRDSIRLLLVSEAPFSVRAEVAFATSNESACELAVPGVYRLVEPDQRRVTHVAAFHWEAGAGLQFFVDDQALCIAPIEFAFPPEMTLYLGGRGTSVEVSDLSVVLLSR